jgi:hypothetical protein
MQDLAHSLAEVRDALTRVSLALSDYQFNCDSTDRGVAKEQLRDLLDKVKGV